MRFWGPFITTFALTCIPAQVFAQSCPQSTGPNKYLVEIAIGQYPEDSAPDSLDATWPKIDRAIESGDELAGHFQTEFCFTLFGALRNEQATREEIRSLVRRLQSSVKPDDQVIFHVVMHGVVRKNAAGIDQGYLVTYETPPNSRVRDDQLLPMSDFLGSLAALEAKDVLVILESCHSGIAVSGIQPDARSQVKGTRLLLATASATQEAIVSESPIFTTALSGVLANSYCDISAEGYCSVEELAMLTRRVVITRSVELLKQSQTPVVAHFGGKEDDDIRMELASAHRWQGILKSNPINLKDLADFKAAYPWYADRADAKIREVELERIKNGENVTVDSLKSLVPAADQAGTRATNARDGLTYVWVPRAVIGGLGNFWIGQTEVSSGAFKKVLPRLQIVSPRFNPKWSSDQLPVVNASYEDAGTFCALAGGRLPSAQEWEFAASGGDPKRWHYPWTFHGGSNEANADLVNMAGEGKYGTPENVLPDPANHNRLLNRFQMAHVLGNVAEWTSSVTTDGTRTRIQIRGGSFADRYDKFDITTPNDADPKGGNTIGFRCLIDPTGTARPEDVKQPNGKGGKHAKSSHP
ncbi:MAG TPA: SUMF1/EgtB/PvdO family nonheme iron enzyme [Bryobacteraceae bacterium]